MNPTISSDTFPPQQGLVARSLVHAAVIALATTLLTNSAQAAFHLWEIREIYTDSSGSLQFVEMFNSFSGENFVNGQQISFSNVGGTETHTFTVPGGALGGSTVNRSLLFGTAGVQAAGGPAPDYIIPNNFIFAAGGTVSFFGQNSGSYSALPTDGVNSRTWNGGNAINSPQNYAGQSGVIVVPEPATWALIGIAGIGFGLLRRRPST